jgi:hypothetical protein
MITNEGVHAVLLLGKEKTGSEVKTMLGEHMSFEYFK